MHVKGQLLISFVSHNDLSEPLKQSTITTAYLIDCSFELKLIFLQLNAVRLTNFES